MAHDEPSGVGPEAGSSGVSTDAHKSAGGRGAQSLQEDVRNVTSDVQKKAGRLASEKTAALQESTASHLRTFANAVRTAGDELAEREPGQVSSLVREAAGGLERFSDVIGQKSPSELMNSVRDFGRKSPLGFLAGSMLVGFALARVASASSSRASGSENTPGSATTATTGRRYPSQDAEAREAVQPSTYGENVNPHDSSTGVIGTGATSAERPGGASIENTWRTDV